jgi:hypothetical protein
MQVDGRVRDVVERGGAGGNSPGVPTIADLLLEYRRLTGASYEDMSKVVNREITTARLHQLATEPPKSFPREAHTVQRLADLLQVPVATIVLAFAASLGLPVSQTGSLLSITLPPGTDSLEADDVAAIRAVVGQLVQARRGVVETPAGVGKTERTGRLVELTQPPAPDLNRVAARHGTSEGRRLRNEQDVEGETQDPAHEHQE